MHMAHPPAGQSLALHLVPLSNQERVQGSINLDLIDFPRGTMDIEDADDDRYIEQIPGVTRLGIKRDCPNVTYRAPSRLQAITPWTTSDDLQQLAKKSDFTTDRSTIDTPVTSRPDPSETHVLHLYNRLQEQLSTVSCQFNNDVNVLKQCIAEKDLLIFRRNKEISDLKHALLERNIQEEALVTRHNRELDEVKHSLRELSERKDALITQSKLETEDLKVSMLQERNTEREGLIVRHHKELEDAEDSLRDLRIEKDALIMRRNREIEDLKGSMLEQNTEREGLIMRHNAEIEELKTRFSMEKLLAEDRHRQQVATYRSEILAVVLQQTSQHQEAAQSSVTQSDSVMKLSERQTIQAVADRDGSSKSFQPSVRRSEGSSVDVQSVPYLYRGFQK